MSITFQCPNPDCKRRMSVKDELAGKKGVCTACKQRLVVPVTNGAVAQAAPAAKPSAAGTAPAADFDAEAAAFFSDGPAAPPVSPAPKPAAAGDLPPFASPPPRRANVPPLKTDRPKGSSRIGNVPADIEAEAAAFLADEPKREEQTATSIKFTCEYCDHAIELGVDLAGKRIPCPECRRILKVPDLAKPVKKDWLKSSQPVAAPEGATGSGKDATMVSEEALEAAGAIPDEPLTRREKIVRWGGVACAAGLAAWGVIAIVGWWGGRKERAAYDSVLEYAKSDAAVKKVGDEGVASLYVSLGEYQRLSKGGAEKAREQFQKALAHLGNARLSSSERDAVLMDLALAQVELGGTDQEADKGTRLKWSVVHKTLVASLSAMRDEEGRLAALRAVTRRLIDLDQGQRAVDLASQVFAAGEAITRTEAVAAVGLELYTAGNKALAEEAASKSLTAEATVAAPPAVAAPPDDETAPPPPPPPRARGKPKLTPSVVALGVVVGRDPDGYDEDQVATRMGQVEGLARKGSWGEARSALVKLQGDEVRDRFRVHVAVAAIGPEGKDDLEAALKLAEAFRSTSDPGTVWTMLRLIDLGAGAGVPDERLMAIADRIGGKRDPEEPARVDVSLRGRGQLLALRAKLARSKEAADDKLVEAVEPRSLSALLAKQALARHNTRLDSGFLKTAQSWSDPAKAFGTVGALQGLRSGDERKKR
jgi:hypothetical protein